MAMMTHESYVSPYVICSRGDSFRLSSIAHLYNMSLRDGCCMLCWPFNMKMGHTLILSLYCAVCNIYYIYFLSQITSDMMLFMLFQV